MLNLHRDKKITSKNRGDSAVNEIQTKNKQKRIGRSMTLSIRVTRNNSTIA